MTRQVAKRIVPVMLALVATVQVAFSSASCCELKAALAGQPACCIADASRVQRSCCQKSSTPSGNAEAVGDSHAPFSPANCLICSAEPKIATLDRVEAPLPSADAGSTLRVATVDAAGPMTPTWVAGPSDARHRTALAACAWLCVWVI